MYISPLTQIRFFNDLKILMSLNLLFEYCIIYSQSSSDGFNVKK